jgi:hypothetical protein
MLGSLNKMTVGYAKMLFIRHFHYNMEKLVIKKENSKKNVLSLDLK